MVKTRNQSGQFSKSLLQFVEGPTNYVETPYPKEMRSPYERNDSNFLYSEIQLGLPKLNLMNLIKVVVLFFFLSPWAYTFFKKGKTVDISGEISQFYESTFSCKCDNLDSSIGNKTNGGL